MDLPDLDLVAAEVHLAWMDSKLAQGITSRRSEAGEELVVPYGQLSEAAKELDRVTVRAVYQAIRQAAAPAQPAAPSPAVASSDTATANNPAAPSRAALLVIDVQEALCRGEYAASGADALIQRINGLCRQARAAGAPVVFIQHEAADGVLAYGTAGWQLAAGLDCHAGDHLVRKTATDSFHQTNLQGLLQRVGAAQLVVCGLQSEFCVDTTTRRALALGYPVVLVADGHSTQDSAVLTAAQISAHHNHTLANISSFGVRAQAVAAKDVRFEVQAS